MISKPGELRQLMKVFPGINAWGYRCGEKIKYVVLKAEDYEALRLAELEIAYQSAMKDVDQGKYKVESAEEHMERLWKKPRKSGK